jgi:hypothetical protein
LYLRAVCQEDTGIAVVEKLGTGATVKSSSRHFTSRALFGASYMFGANVKLIPVPYAEDYLDLSYTSVPSVDNPSRGTIPLNTGINITCFLF